MAIQTCPTAIVQTPAARAWSLLTIPRELERWSGTRILKGPGGPLAAGDRLVLGAGPFNSVRIGFHILAAEAPRRFALDILMPLGMVNHEVVIITPISNSQCRVTFN